MARKRRLNLAGIPQHIIQRGNNRDLCFASNEDFAAYTLNVSYCISRIASSSVVRILSLYKILLQLILFSDLYMTSP